MDNQPVVPQLTDVIPFEFSSVDLATNADVLPSAATMAGLAQLAQGTPKMVEALQHALTAGTTFRVTFSPEAMASYASGAARLMQTQSGTAAVMRNAATGQIMEHGRVVAEHASAGAAAAAAVPMLVAAAATYAQQRRMEEALNAIQKAVEGLAQRALDTENGVCLAAEQFAMMAAQAIQSGGSLGPYMRQELALHRQAVGAVHEARHLYVERFGRELTEAQNRLEQKKGEAHPWVKVVTDKVKDERLVEELELYALSLVTDVRLALLSAQAILEDGGAESAAALAEATARRFRERFYAYFRRVRPLGEIAPERRIWDKLPLVGESEQRAFGIIQELVKKLQAQVEPLIPPEEQDRVAYIDVGPTATQAVLRLVEAA
ncbi:MAG: hypothetical protein H6513_16920 [Acidimicrobiaceae bacterium]|nr:hypothetical protein [Acidimicrobiaceae bacterium]